MCNIEYSLLKDRKKELEIENYYQYEFLELIEKIFPNEFEKAYREYKKIKQV